MIRIKMNKMKRYLFILMAAAAMLTACQEKKESTVIIAPKPEPVKPSGPILMQDMKAENSVEWIGKTYKVIVNRKVDRELPMVEVEPGKKAYDNRISLTIVRPDGTEFFNKEYTKAAFMNCLDENTKKNGVLLGIVFIPMVLTVGRMGDVSIKRDTTMDTSNDQEQQEEDEGV